MNSKAKESKDYQLMKEAADMFLAESPCSPRILYLIYLRQHDMLELWYDVFPDILREEREYDLYFLEPDYVNDDNDAVVFAKNHPETYDGLYGIDEVSNVVFRRSYESDNLPPLISQPIDWGDDVSDITGMEVCHKLFCINNEFFTDGKTSGFFELYEEITRKICHAHTLANQFTERISEIGLNTLHTPVLEISSNDALSSMVLGENRTIRFPEYNAEIKMEAAQLALYVFYLKPIKDGKQIADCDILDYSYEISHLYHIFHSPVAKFRDEDFYEDYKKVKGWSSESLRSKNSHINKLIKSILQSYTKQYSLYQIPSGSGKTRNIQIPVDKSCSLDKKCPDNLFEIESRPDTDYPIVEKWNAMIKEESERNRSINMRGISEANKKWIEAKKHQ